MIEIPYVPASQRKPVELLEDSVIVVGQMRQKKRKRIKTKAIANVGDHEQIGDSSKAHSARSENDNTDIFDYATAPNILDDVPEPKEEPHKKKKIRDGTKRGAYLEMSWCLMIDYHKRRG